MTATEINSSFYRSHRPVTYARSAASVPPTFRFAVKVPREISHRRRLVDTSEPLERFLMDVRALGDRLGPLLLQLPPNLAYDGEQASTFLKLLRIQFDGDVVVEPRHPTWFTDAVDGVLTQLWAGRVAADPSAVPRAAMPGGWPGITYHRLHGSPRMYYSAHEAGYLDAIAQSLRDTAPQTGERWCIFDNTADGAAAEDAFSLLRLL